MQGSDQITGPSARVGLDSYQTVRPSAQAVSCCLDPFRQQVAVTVAGACSSVVATAVAGVEACVPLKLGRRRDWMFASSFAASTESWGRMIGPLVLLGRFLAGRRCLSGCLSQSVIQRIHP